MSRHRTTAKMHRATEKQGGSTPAETTGEDPSPQDAGVAAEARDNKDEVLTVEKLGRYLAAEIAQREVSEERTTSFLARFFKLNLVMAGINVVVAVVCVAVLLGRSDKPQTVVIAPPIAPPPAQTPAPAPQPTETAQLAIPAAAPPVVTPPPAPAAATPAPAKLHLLGEPQAPARRRASFPGPNQPPQVASKPLPTRPLPTRPMVVARNVDEESSLELSKQTERW